VTDKPKRDRANACKQSMPIAYPQLLRDICGPAHIHLQMLERAFAEDHLRAESQGGEITLTGENDACRKALEVLEAFAQRIQAGAEASVEEFEAALKLSAGSVAANVVHEAIMGLRKPVLAQTAGQREYLDMLRKDESGLVFGVGPAGTGKTYLAVAVGAAELKAGKRERLVVTRPAVEAGEKLGFLPGDMEDKVDPYMLPIWDALNEFLGAQEVERRKERKEIEVAPVAFMRGRTLKNAFVIVDEAQNATVPQMKMVLTRLGRGSRMVVTGDPSQTDLPFNTRSGLEHAIGILNGVKGVEVMRLKAADVVRHELVARIVQAYDKDTTSRGPGKP
jgi:phosphate starvation-inducible PhoH-like protein